MYDGCCFRKRIVFRLAAWPDHIKFLPAEILDAGHLAGQDQVVFEMLEVNLNGSSSPRFMHREDGVNALKLLVHVPESAALHSEVSASSLIAGSPPKGLRCSAGECVPGAVFSFCSLRFFLFMANLRETQGPSLVIFRSHPQNLGASPCRTGRAGNFLLNGWSAMPASSRRDS